MKLSREDLGKLRSVVIDAITSEEELARLLSDRMNLRLDTIVKPDNLENVVFELLNWLNARARIVEFIDALVAERPFLKSSLATIRTVAAAPGNLIAWTGIGASAGWRRLGFVALAAVLISGLVWALVGWPGYGWITKEVARIPSPTVTRDDSKVASPKGTKEDTKIASPKVPKETPRETPSQPSTNLDASLNWSKAFAIRGQRVVYASPDDIYAVLEERFGQAQNSILIAMYEFNSPHVKDWLIQAVGRKVKVTLLLGSRKPGNADSEIIDGLVKGGIEVVEASRGRDRTFFAYHPKLIVIDGKWTMIQTGNLTETSVPSPQAKSGNRDVGIAIESPELATYFSDLFAADKTRLQQEAGGQPNYARADDVYDANTPVRRFPALRLGGPPAERPTRILPVHVPENYPEYVSELLASAQQSIEIVEPYILPGQTVLKLLKAIETAHSRNVRVRIILGSYGAKRTIERLRECCAWLSQDSMRVLNRQSGINLTGKLVIVDQRVSLVASANWSENGITKNREFGVMIDAPNIAEYYGKIFQVDWERGSPVSSIADASADGETTEPPDGN